MKKRKESKNKKKESLNDFLSQYDSVTLQTALQSVEGSIGWELLQSFLRTRQREFEIAALDLMGHTGNENEAAKASGYALGMEEMAERIIPEFISFLKGNTGVIEEARPESN